MRAVVFKDKCNVAVEQVEDPRIEAPTDVVVRLTSTAICGSDLHMYEGRTSAQPGMVFGHENMGVVEEVGPGVVNIRRGDRVVMPFNIACGFCFNCLRGFYSGCTTTNPQSPGAAYGYANLGPYRGGQAEYLRVPFADFNCTKLPGQAGDQWEDDFVCLADIFPTGFHAAVLAQIQPGSSVAIFGAGPVGLMATISAFLMGAAQVFVVDRVPERLAKAKELGATPIDFTGGDPVEQIMQMRRDNPGITGAWRPGEEKLAGVMCGIDAVGYQARDRQDPAREKPTQVVEDLVRLVNATGTLSLIGVYMPQDPGAAEPHAQHGMFEIPFGQIWNKGLMVGRGQAPVKRYQEQLRDLIVAGRCKPSQIVSHREPLERAPELYQLFDQRGDGYTKIILKPELRVAA
jgi:glutathione-independent formaldehyde dehydrogenase